MGLFDVMKRNILLFAFFILLAILFAFLARIENSAQIVIGNPESHPRKGGNWTIFFDTKGKGSLWIIPQDQPTLNDLEFSYLACNGDKIVDVRIQDKTIIVPDWQCNGQSVAVFKVKTMGNHELAFNFADKTVLAHNSSQTTYDFTASTTVTRFGYQGQAYATTVPVAVDRTTWSIASGTQFTAAQYIAASTSDNTYATTGATTSWFVAFPQIVHDFEFRVNEATSTIVQIDYHWEGKGTQNKETASQNDLRLYVYDKAGNAFRLGDSELNNSCTSTDCTMTYSTTSNIANFFDADKDIRFLVQKYEIGHNCSSSPTTLTCAYQATGTDTLGGEVSLACTTQAGTDYWNQCSTSSNSCSTDLCSTPGFGQSPLSCGIWVDNAQHNCTAACYGCSASSPSSTCAPLSATAGAASQALGCGDGDGCDVCSSGSCAAVGAGTGCGTGDCEACNGSGSCDTTWCEGQQCGCDPGEVCYSGVCGPVMPANCAIACGGIGSCFPDAGTCFMSGGTPDGNALNCLPTALCCCGI